MKQMIILKLNFHNLSSVITLIEKFIPILPVYKFEKTLPSTTLQNTYLTEMT